MGTAPQRSLFLLLLHWGKFAADRLCGCSGFRGCFCWGLVGLRPVRWFSPFNYSFCLTRTAVSSSLPASALSCSRAMAQEWVNVNCLAEKVLSVLGFPFLFCHAFLTDLHAALVGLQRLCTVSCVAHSMNWISVPSLLLCLF